MHLVMSGVKLRFTEDELKKQLPRRIDFSWWYGYILGLFEGELLSQSEHDHLAGWLAEIATIEEER